MRPEKENQHTPSTHFHSISISFVEFKSSIWFAFRSAFRRTVSQSSGGGGGGDGGYGGLWFITLILIIVYEFSPIRSWNNIKIATSITCTVHTLHAHTQPSIFEYNYEWNSGEYEKLCRSRDILSDTPKHISSFMHFYLLFSNHLTYTLALALALALTPHKHIDIHP